MHEVEFIKSNKLQYFLYLKSKFPIFHLSNVFYRDLRYGLKYFLNENGYFVSDAELENTLSALIHEMTGDGILKEVSPGVWTVNYPEFKTKTSGKPVL